MVGKEATPTQSPKQQFIKGVTASLGHQVLHWVGIEESKARDVKRRGRFHSLVVLNSFAFQNVEYSKLVDSATRKPQFLPSVFILCFVYKAVFLHICLASMHVSGLSLFAVL